MSNVQNRFRVGLLKLAYSYSRLVALSYGFQHAFGKRDAEDNPFLTRVCSTESGPRYRNNVHFLSTVYPCSIRCYQRNGGRYWCAFAEWVTLRIIVVVVFLIIYLVLGIYVRHGPMAQMVFVSFAATFLVSSTLR